MKRALISFLLGGAAVLAGAFAVTVWDVSSSDNPPQSAAEWFQGLFPDAVGVAKHPNYIPSMDILSYAQEAAMSTEGEELFLSAAPESLRGEAFNEACSGVSQEPGVGILGCYYPGEHKIYLYDIVDSRLKGIEPAVAAHEMLHAAWETLDAEAQAAIGSQLIEAFLALPEGNPVAERLRSYVNAGPEELATELHSIMGTEAAELPPALEAHYAQFLTDRQGLAMSATTSYGIFTNTEEQAEALIAELDQMQAVIETRKREVSNEDISLSAAIQYFNDQAASGAFATQEAYDAERRRLETRQQDLQEATDELNELIAQFNVKVDELSMLNGLLTELNQGVNIPTKN